MKYCSQQSTQNLSEAQENKYTLLQQKVDVLSILRRFTIFYYTKSIPGNHK